MASSQQLSRTLHSTLFAAATVFVFLLLVTMTMSKVDGAAILVRQRSTVQDWERHRIRQPCSGSDEIVSVTENVERRHVHKEHVEAAAPKEDEQIMAENYGHINGEVKLSVVTISRLLQRLKAAVEQFRNLYVSNNTIKI